MSTAASIPGDNHRGREHDTPSVESGAGPHYDGSMDRRLTAVEARLDAVIATMATKSDIAQLRLEIQKIGFDGALQASQLRGEMATMGAELRGEMAAMGAELRADMRRIESTLTKWMVSTIVSMFIGFAGLYHGMSTQLTAAVASMAPAAPAHQK